MFGVKVGSKTLGIIGFILAMGGEVARHPNVIGDETANKVAEYVEAAGVIVGTLFGGAVLRNGTRTRTRRED